MKQGIKKYVGRPVVSADFLAFGIITDWTVKLCTPCKSEISVICGTMATTNFTKIHGIHRTTVDIPQI
jgi:hypothetical protein